MSSTIIDLVFSNVKKCAAKVVPKWKISDHETLGIHVNGMSKVEMPDVKEKYTFWQKFSKQ